MPRCAARARRAASPVMRPPGSGCSPSPAHRCQSRRSPFTSNCRRPTAGVATAIMPGRRWPGTARRCSATSCCNRRCRRTVPAAMWRRPARVSGHCTSALRRPIAAPATALPAGNRRGSTIACSPRRRALPASPATPGPRERCTAALAPPIAPPATPPAPGNPPASTMTGGSGSMATTRRRAQHATPAAICSATPAMAATNTSRRR